MSIWTEPHGSERLRARETGAPRVERTQETPQINALERLSATSGAFRLAPAGQASEPIRERSRSLLGGFLLSWPAQGSELEAIPDFPCWLAWIAGATAGLLVGALAGGFLVWRESRAALVDGQRPTLAELRARVRRLRRSAKLTGPDVDAAWLLDADVELEAIDGLVTDLHDPRLIGEASPRQARQELAAAARPSSPLLPFNPE